VIFCRCSSDLKEVVVEVTYSCWADVRHRLQQQHHLGNSLADLELSTSLEWRPQGHTMRGPQLQSDYVSMIPDL